MVGVARASQHGCRHRRQTTGLWHHSVRPRPKGQEHPAPCRKDDGRRPNHPPQASARETSLQGGRAAWDTAEQRLLQWWPAKVGISALLLPSPRWLGSFPSPSPPSGAPRSSPVGLFISFTVGSCRVQDLASLCAWKALGIAPALCKH